MAVYLLRQYTYVNDLVRPLVHGLVHGEGEVLGVQGHLRTEWAGFCGVIRCALGAQDAVNAFVLQAWPAKLSPLPEIVFYTSNKL